MAMKEKSIYNTDKVYGHLLRHGHCSAYASNAAGVEQRAWLELAIDWWEAIADRARDDGLLIVSYRGWDEMGTYSAYTTLLHPHTSTRLIDYREYQGLAARELPAASAICRDLAAEREPNHPELAEPIEADYERLIRDGTVTGPRGPGGSVFRELVRDYPDQESYIAAFQSHWEAYQTALRTWREAELFPWCEALTDRARGDRRHVFCAQGYEGGGSPVYPAAHVLDETVRMPVTWLRDLTTVE